MWNGNSRGSSYSLEHVKYTTEDKEFWDFSFGDMADYDIPAAFKYIANITN